MKVQVVVAAVAKTPKELARLAVSAKVGDRMSAALNKATPAEVLSKLASDANGRVRSMVAANPNSDLTTLKKLTQDELYGVRAALARRPKLPKLIAMKLAVDKSWVVRGALAVNETTILEVFDKLTDGTDYQDHIDYGIKINVAKNHSTPAKVLVKLANTPDERGGWLHLHVSENPNTPKDVAKKLRLALRKKKP